MKKIAFIINGTYRRKEQIKKEIHSIFCNDFEIEFFQTKRNSHGIELSRQAIEKKTEYIIAVGGDGTLNEVVNGFMQSSTLLRDKVKIGLIPRGTGNDFARCTGIKKDIKSLYELIKNQQLKLTDIGQAEFKTFDNNSIKRYFCNITDIGIGAQTVKIVNNSSKFWGGNLTFIFSAIQSFFGYKYQFVKITTPEFCWEGDIVSTVIANGQYFGSGIGIASHSLVDDGKFELVIVGRISMWTFLKNLPKLKKKQPVFHDKVKYFSVDSCKIESLSHPYPIDMDGEYIGYLPLETKLLPNQINFIRP